MASGPAVALIGTGNVAWHFGLRLFNQGVSVAQVYGRNLPKSSELAHATNSTPILSLSDLRDDLDYYIIMVTDNQISEVSRAMPDSLKGLVVHTAGSVGVEAIRQPHKAVVYPLQTFTKGFDLDWSTVRMFTTAEDSQDWDKADALSALLSPIPPVHITDLQRLRLHMAAVWACNFLNFMLVQAQDILAQDGLSVNELKPLIDVAMDKAFSIGPRQGQTGPAKRGDLATIAKHMDCLSPSQAKLYATLSNQIMRYYGLDASIRED